MMTNVLCSTVQACCRLVPQLPGACFFSTKSLCARWCPLEPSQIGDVAAGAPRRRARGARGRGPVSGARRPRAGGYRLSRPYPG
eukprot:scaffold15366_cov70-Phaeocystis_antarctica.AAC.2